MTAAGVLNPNSHMKRYGKILPPAPKLSLRRELEISLTVFVNMARNARKEHNAKMLARARAQVANLTEQLLIMDCIEYGFIKPVPGCGK